MLPPATASLILPPERLVSVVSTPGGDGSWSTLTFEGDLLPVNRPPRVTLAWVATEDAVRLVALLNRRYGLPRVPLELPPAALPAVAAHALVSVVNVLQRGHVEGANFGAVQVTSDEEAALELARSGPRVVRATGFYAPPLKRGPGPPPCVGYGGPRIHALGLSAPEWHFPTADAQGVCYRAYTSFAPGRVRSELAAWTLPAGDRTIAGSILGGGAGETAAETARLVARLLSDPHAVLSDASPRVLSALDRSPLPHDPGLLVRDIAHRLDAVYAAGSSEGPLYGQGVLACVAGRRLAMLGRGLARAHLRREGRPRLVMSDSAHRFDGVGRTGSDSVVELETQPGDRVLITAGALGDAPLEARLRHSEFEAMIGALLPASVGPIGVVEIAVP